MNVNIFSMPWINNDIGTLTENSMQATDSTKLEITHLSYWRILFFFLVTIICYPCDKRAGGDGANCEGSGSQESLGSHPKRWKDKPWTHHLTSPHFRFPIVSEMRRTLIICPTKGLKGTTRKSIGSTLNSSEVSFYGSSKPLIKGHVHTFLRLQWVVCGWDNV